MAFPKILFRPVVPLLTHPAASSGRPRLAFAPLRLNGGPCGESGRVCAILFMATRTVVSLATALYQNSLFAVHTKSHFEEHDEPNLLPVEVHWQNGKLLQEVK